MASDTSTAQHEQHILDCWHQNAAPWVDAIRNDEIASRVLATNRAIESAIAPISESDSPSSPSVTAPIGNTSKYPAS